MSALTEIESSAKGAVSGGIWKVATGVLLAMLLATGGGLSFEWWLAAHDRDKATADLKAELGVTAQLRAGIDLQNARLVQLDQEKQAADARGAAAQQLAAAKGRRLDGALAELASARATTCAEAMPAVNQLLKDIK